MSISLTDPQRIILQELIKDFQSTIETYNVESRRVSRRLRVLEEIFEGTKNQPSVVQHETSQEPLQCS